jgi:hypothetical protein
MFCRLVPLACLLAVMPVVAQDKTAAVAKKYQSVGTVAGKLKCLKSDDHKIEIEGRVFAGRRWQNYSQTFSLVDEVKVRRLTLPERLDERNKPIPYTAAEKVKLKGNDPKLPGYTAELSALAPGQTVELHLATPKPAAGTKTKAKSAEPEKPLVTMIVIGGDAPKMPNKDADKKRPNKKGN